MSLVDKLTNGAKKGIDWFTFADGLVQQNIYRKQAKDIGSTKLAWKVSNSTCANFMLCAGLPAISYAILVRSIGSDGNLTFGEAYFSTFLICALEKFRCQMREKYFYYAQPNFEDQINESLTFYEIPTQILKIDDPEPGSYQRPVDYWKNKPSQ